MGKILLRKLMGALRLLTIVPLPPPEGAEEPEGIPAFFPAVGVLMGAALFIGGRIALVFWSMDAVAAMVLLGWVAVTGGLHLDGLTDTADGLGGGETREKRLRIMKDSRIGTFGASALVFSLLLKYSFLGEVETGLLFPILICVPAVARSILLGGMHLFPSARPDGMGAFFKKRLRRGDLMAAWAGTGFLVLFLTGPVGILVTAAAAGVGWLAAYGMDKLQGGLTGDSYGALCEISEIALLAGFTAAQRLILFPFWEIFFP